MRIFDCCIRFARKDIYNVKNYHHLFEFNNQGHIFYKEKIAISKSYAIYRVNDFTRPAGIDQFVFFYLPEFNLYWRFNSLNLSIELLYYDDTYCDWYIFPNIVLSVLPAGLLKAKSKTTKQYILRRSQYLSNAHGLIKTTAKQQQYLYNSYIFFANRIQPFILLKSLAN